MQIVWDDQWISFDNERTFRLKIDYANEHCIGGTAVWAIDYDSCNDNGELPSVETAHLSSATAISIATSPGPLSGVGSPTPVSDASASGSSPVRP